MKGNNMAMLKGTLLLTGIAGLLLASVAQADTQLNITGTIKASPCTVDTTGTGVNVDLGQNIQAASLSTATSGSDWVTFPLKLKDCPASTSSVTATFAGTPADEKADVYKNTGTATNVQVELQSAANANLGNGKTMTQPVSATTNDATFDLRARAYSFAGGVTPGSIIGTVQVSFTYL
jgi:minor fimbrial subunit